MKLKKPNFAGISRKKKWLIPTIVGLAITIFFCFAYNTKSTPLESVSNLLFDVFQRQHPRIYNPETPVKIIDIDDESIKRVGQWPWPRTVMAEFNDRLADAGAAVIGYDILFSEKDRTSPENMISVLQQNPQAVGDFSDISKLKSHDAIFADSFRRTRVVAGMFLTNTPQETLPVKHHSFSFSGASPINELESYQGALHALPILDEAAAGGGYVSFIPDGDGIIRTAPLVGRVGDRIFPSLSIEMLRSAQDASTYIIKSDSGSGELGIEANIAGSKAPEMAMLRVGSFEIPTTADGKILVHYTENKPERFIPAWKILSNENVNQDWQEDVAGKLIFVGTSAEGLKDIVTTPQGGGQAGVIVHAQVAEQIIEGDYLYRPYWTRTIELFGILLLGGIFSLILPRLKAARGLILFLYLSLTVYFGAKYAFSEFNYLIDPVYPIMTLATCYVLITMTSFYLTESERSLIRGAFSLYLSPSMVKAVSENPDLLVLGGEERVITVLFLDVRSFSKISEYMSPAEITTFLNKFLTPMTDILQDYNATIDKYIGDAIVAFWNAPLDDPQHERNAARAVLKMNAALADLNVKYRGQNDFKWPDDVKIGIGLNTGLCCVGNLGSKQRFSYSMIGDTANLASRIEGLTKQYGISTLVGNSTASAITRFATLEADIVSVVGRDAPEIIHMVLGNEDVAVTQKFQTLEIKHKEFLEQYRNRNWAEAKALADTLIELGDPFKIDRYYSVMQTRIDSYVKSSPPNDWGGIFHTDEK